MKLRQYQIDAIAGVRGEFYAGKKRVILVSPTGSGKCLGRGTPVLMYSGQIKPVEEVVVGDLLMGPDSAARMVLSTCVGTGNLYRIDPVKGDSYVTNGDHILSLKLTGVSSNPKKAPINIQPIASIICFSQGSRALDSSGYCMEDRLFCHKCRDRLQPIERSPQGFAKGQDAF